MNKPFATGVLREVERLNGAWHDVPADAAMAVRVGALSFPKRLISPDEVDQLRPEDCGLPDVDAVIALDGVLPHPPVTEQLPVGIRWCGHQWQSGDPQGSGSAPVVDLAGDDDLLDALEEFRAVLGDPQASRAVLLTFSDSYPNYFFVHADDSCAEDPRVWSTDHEEYFTSIDEVAPSQSTWLAAQLTDADIYRHLRT